MIILNIVSAEYANFYLSMILIEKPSCWPVMSDFESSLFIICRKNFMVINNILLLFIE